MWFWFWFWFIALVSALTLVYRALTIFYPGIRVVATHSHCRLIQQDEIKCVLNHGRVGDWFLLDLLSKNMDPLNFRDLILDLNHKFELTKDTKNGV